MIDHRLLICVVCSIVGHLVLGEVLETLPPRPPPKLDHKIEVAVVQPPPPPPEPEPEPEKPPEPKPEPKVVREKPVARPNQATVKDVIAKDVPVDPHAVVATQSDEQPVFGVTMESTSQGGGKPVPVGNTPTPQPGASQPTSKPAGAPVAAYEVTKMPLPQGRCSGKYTDDARAAAIEGTVVLDLVVDERGRAREITVVQGLAHGLTEAAITALQQCQFSPGEKSGQKVAVRVRGFKIRFVLGE